MVQAPKGFALVLLSAVSCLLGLGLLEGSLRVRQLWKYGTAKIELSQMMVTTDTALPVLKPNQRGRIETDSRGFRNPELLVPKPPNTLRIGFLGASTTYCAEVSGNRATWPSLVTERLGRQYPDLEFDYINTGVPGYNSEQSLKVLETRFEGIDPDVLVYYEATNEVTKDSRKLAIAQGVFGGRTAESSFLGEHLLFWHLAEFNLKVLARSRASTQHLQFTPRELSVNYEARLRRLVARARQLSPVVVLVTFSSRVRANQSPDEQLKAAANSLYYAPYFTPRDLLTCYREYNRVCRQVARDTGSVLIEGEDVIPADAAHFTDTVHFTDAGCDLQAKRVIAGLMASDQFASLLRARQEIGTP